jgi:hypothetical protein
MATAIINLNSVIKIFILVLLLNHLLQAQYFDLKIIESETNQIKIGVQSLIESYIQTVDGYTTFNIQELLDESTPGKPQLPAKIFFIAIPPNSKVIPAIENKTEKTFKNFSVKINPKVVEKNDSTLEYVPVELSPEYLSQDLYPSSPVEILNYIWIRDYYCAVIKINPIQFNWKSKSLNSLQSFDINLQMSDVQNFRLNNNTKGEFDNDLNKIILNYDQADKFRSFQPQKISDSSGEWIDYTKIHYKISTKRDGIYRIGYNELLSYGINPSDVNPKTLKIFRQGKQIPIYVEGENDLSFDENDFIEFWSTKNYNPEDYRKVVATGEDYINYMDRYSDTTFLWLNFGGEDGIRLRKVNADPVVTLDTIKTHLVKKHFENDVRLWYYGATDPRTQLPFWQEHKVYTWLTIGSSGSQNITFPASDFVSNSKVQTTTRLISNAGDVIQNAHKHGASLNSTTPQDTIIFDYYRTVNFNSIFSSSQLVNGNNSYRVFGLPSSASFHRSLIDWVDIEYHRYNKATNDSLLLIIPDSVSTDLRNIRVTNILTPDSLLIILKISSEPKIISGYYRENDILVFSDSVGGGDIYLIIKQGSYLTPKFHSSKFFRNLRNQSLGADYILITHRSLAQSTDEYVQFIRDHYNLRVEKVYIDDIYDEFSYGQNHAESIRYFLTYAFNNWQQPSPSYLSLIGDSNYDYKDIWNPAPTTRKKNLVPSYGYPVSDSWFVMWSESNINLPQMYVGRIPANNDNEVRTYLTKHQNYVNRRFDDYNKRYTFYSGGDPTNPSELAQIKAANDLLLNNYVTPPPVSGVGIHFYKTLDPPSNLGPYDLEQIDNAKDSSGLFISYIGHSGTRTWDNGITEVEDIKNAFSDRHPLISDFGCSTGKFAEPDVDAFGELFISQSSNGQAICYLGNSSLGYLSSSLRYPELFYNRILFDYTTTISRAHLLAKIDQFNLTGYSDVNKVFNYCNLLFADPLIKFALPEKPNFIINQKSVILPQQISDIEDSIFVKLNIYNWGKSISDSLRIYISNTYKDSVTFSEYFKIQSPSLSGELQFYLKTKSQVGLHNLKIYLDPDNLIEEIYEDDNFVELAYSVFSTSVRPIITENYYSTNKDSVLFLNPIYKKDESDNHIVVSLSQDSEFLNSQEFLLEMDTLASKFVFSNLEPKARYFYRARLNSQEIQWSPIYSFKNDPNIFEWFIDSSFRDEDFITNKVSFDSSISGWKLEEVNNYLKISSAGSNDGKFASMLFNETEYLPNTFYWGIASAEIDSITYEPYNIKYYAWPNTITQNSDSLTNYINSLPNGKMVALTICDDAAQTVLGFSGGTSVRRAIETLGSLYIDSVRYRESWSIIGVKGAPVGSVKESYKKLFQGAAIIDTSKLVVYNEGTVTFPPTGNSKLFQNLTISHVIPQGGDVQIIPVGIRKDSSTDTLDALTFEDMTASLSDINSELYPQIKIIAKLKSNELKESPSVFSLGINYLPPPELAINYQVVKIDSDTIYQGNKINFKFEVHNVGEIAADSFNVKVELIKSDKTKKIILDSLIISLNGKSKIPFDINYVSNQYDGYGNLSFLISIDEPEKLLEIFEDNNIYEIPFYVIKDTTVSSVTETSITALFDGVEILDGDFVSASPLIDISLHYPIWFPINDTSAVEFYLNTNRINYDQFKINYDTVNRIANYQFSPALSDGDYSFRIYGVDIDGRMQSQPGFEKYFNVQNKLEALNVYNYPNPFSEKTYFTFVLTQLPEDLRIKIFTVAGRLIREIKLTSTQLNVGFNRIEWDGRDEDNDNLANGVYLYKLITTDAENSFSITQKLVIAR